MVQRPDTTTADQFRMLRFKLVDRPSSQVIAVTGPTRGVGTSVTAANLALSLAEAGRARVVIVDTDVRAARQGEIFGIESDVGLTLELERRHANPDISARVVAVAASMAILPAGRDVPNPTAMLGSDVMARFLEDLRFMYDHVILDVAPVLERSDAAAIHNLVDTFVLVAMSGVTSTDEIEKAEEKLPRKKVAGVVLNSVPKQPRGFARGLLHLMGTPARRKRYLNRGKPR
jgi:capsular exopolysaccharide synthesis family protein